MGETEYRYLSRRRPKLGLRHALKTVVELAFPPSLYCACCGNIIDSTRTYSLCDHCMDHFRWDRSDGISSEDIKPLANANAPAFIMLFMSLEFNPIFNFSYLI